MRSLKTAVLVSVALAAMILPVGCVKVQPVVIRPEPTPTPPPAPTGTVQATSHRYSRASADFWTVVASCPEASGADGEARAERDAQALAAKGIDAFWAPSATWPSLRPGYLVVFAGEHGSAAQAEALLGTVRAAGFSDAYTRHFSQKALAAGGGEDSDAGAASAGADGDGSDSSAGEDQRGEAAGETGGDVDPVSRGDAATLLSEDFGGAFPADTWEIGSAAAKRAASIGRPAPSLALGEPQERTDSGGEGGPTVGGTPGNGSVRSITTFYTGDGLTVSFDLLMQGGGTAVFRIADITQGQWSQDRTGVVADLSNGSGSLFVGTSGKNLRPPADGKWHHYEFRVSDDYATWSRDGAQWWAGGYSPRTVYLHLSSSPTTAWFDNIEVTSP